jgi:hypothetical protein
VPVAALVVMAAVRVVAHKPPHIARHLSAGRIDEGVAEVAVGTERKRGVPRVLRQAVERVGARQAVVGVGASALVHVGWHGAQLLNHAQLAGSVDGVQPTHRAGCSDSMAARHSGVGMQLWLTLSGGQRGAGCRSVATHVMKSRIIASKYVLFQLVAGRSLVQSEGVSSATTTRGLGNHGE